MVTLCYLTIKLLPILSTFKKSQDTIKVINGCDMRTTFNIHERDG